MLCHWDGYTSNIKNYLLYHDVDAQRMVFLPHDLDQMLREPTRPIVPRAKGIVSRAILADPELRKRYLERFGQLYTGLFVPSALTRRVDEAVRPQARLQEPPLPRLHAAGDRRRRKPTCANCARRAWSERYGATRRPSAGQLRQARQRLEHELGIICRMGFAGYFLIVWDFVRFAVSKGIPAGARGSALRRHRQLRAQAEPRLPAGVRPAVRAVPRPESLRGARHRHRLLPGPPRGGHRRTSARSTAKRASPRSRTFGTMAAKAAIKDVGRVLDVPLERVNRLTAWCPRCSTSRSTKSLQQSPDLRREYDDDPRDPRADRHRHASWRAPTATPARTPPASSSPTGRSPTTCRVQRVTRKDGGKEASRSSPRSGSWATSKRSACSRWTSSACAR